MSHRCSRLELTRSILQSGQSLIDHAYKADSDLAPQGIEYAQKLKAFIVQKRKELQEDRTQNGEVFQERKLTVRPTCFRIHSLPFFGSYRPRSTRLFPATR